MIDTELAELLRETFAERAGTVRTARAWAPPAPPTPRRRSHRWITPLAAALLILAVTAVVLVLRPSAERAPATPSPSVSSPAPSPTTERSVVPPAVTESLGWRIELSVPGYEVHERAAVPGRFDTITLHQIGDTTAACCGGVHNRYAVTVYVPGAFDSSVIKDGQPVRINAVPAVYGSAPAADFDGLIPLAQGSLPTLAYEDQGRWVLVRSMEGPDLQGMISVASAVKIVAPRNLRVPLRLGYLPDTLRPVRVYHDLLQRYGLTVDLADGTLGSASTTALAIQVWNETGPVNGPDSVAGTISVDGRKAYLLKVDGYGLSVDIPLGDRTIDTGLNGPHASEQDFQKILTGIHLAGDDPSTWFDATTMLP